MSRLARRDTSDSVWNFAFRGTSLLIIPNPAEDPSLWRISQFTISAVDPNHPRDLMWGAAVLPDPDSPAHLLVYGIDSTQLLNRALLLGRAPLSTVERPDTWTYYRATGSSALRQASGPLPESNSLSLWVFSISSATPVASNLAPELSIHFLPASNAYVMIHSEPPLDAGILARTAPRPEGPWSAPTTLYACPEPATDPRTLVYAPKAHPELSGANDLLISYCVNSTDFWFMASHADLYLPRIIRVPGPLLWPNVKSAR